MSLGCFLIGMAAGIAASIVFGVIVVVMGSGSDKMMEDDIWPKL